MWQPQPTIQALGVFTDQKGFESEISALEKQIKNKKTTDDLVVFYGSSTIRLWNSLQDDFPHTNTLNLGFGGAFISSLSQNFDRLFTFEAPKAIVLYLGGNDLSLGWTRKIVEKSILMKNPANIHTTIVNLSIKLRTGDQMEKSWRSTNGVLAKNTAFLEQIDFDALMEEKR